MRVGFTLIELLVVIAIIAILSVVVILSLNPAALLQQSRDANRVSDMSVLNSALGIYLSAGGTSLGNSNTVYVSIADPAATSTAGDQCQGLGLISLPATYTYHCAASSTLRNVDSTGWIPVNFGSVAIGSSLSQLPLDPINQSSSRLYYTYSTNGTQYEVTSVMESAKYQVGGSNDVISGDGGTLVSVYEKGSKLGLEPLDYGDSSLVGLWSFNEGTGTVAYDYSGNNATGSWSGSLINGSYYTTGKIGSYAGNFDGGTDKMNGQSMTLPSTFSVSAWVNPNNNIFSNSYDRIAETSYSSGFYLGLNSNDTQFHWIVNNTNNPLFGNCIGGTVTSGIWQYVVGVYDGTNGYLYVNGSRVAGPIAFTSPGTFTHSFHIGYDGVSAAFWSGAIDDVRVYNRALSATQIAAMYNGGK